MTDQNPTPLTEEEAAALRAQLAAHEAAQALARAQEENARRAEKREALAPTEPLVAALATPVAALKENLPALTTADWDLASLARNAITCAEALATRLERRLADIQPVPEPEAPLAA